MRLLETCAFFGAFSAGCIVLILSFFHCFHFGLHRFISFAVFGFFCTFSCTLRLGPVCTLLGLLFFVGPSMVQIGLECVCHKMRLRSAAIGHGPALHVLPSLRGLGSFAKIAFWVPPFFARFFSPSFRRWTAPASRASI